MNETAEDKKLPAAGSGTSCSAPAAGDFLSMEIFSTVIS